MKPEHVQWMKDLAASLDKAGRMGTETDEPEGSRYITMSDTLANEVSSKLHEILNEESNLLFDVRLTPGPQGYDPDEYSKREKAHYVANWDAHRAIERGVIQSAIKNMN